jgi:hypothetical protein
VVSWYQVPPGSEGEFLALIEQAAQVYGAHALSWRIGRSVETPGLWSEQGPVFREEADREKASAELGDGLARFRLDVPPGVDATAPAWGVIERWPGDYETVLEVGDPRAQFSPGRPPIEPGEMTAAMRAAHALAASLVERLNPVLPAPMSVAASSEVVEVYDDGRLVTWMSFVDAVPEEAVFEFLDQLQRDVSEITTEPWPRDPGGGYEFHDPAVEEREGALHVTFGPDDNPVLALEPIPLSDLGR